MQRSRIDLADEVRKKSLTVLNERLADILDLHLQAKQAHWNVKGPNFIALHELFDSIAGLLPDQADEIAERITALGGIAEGTIAAITARSHLPAYPIDVTGGNDHLNALSTAVATFGKAVRADIDRTAEWGDTGTSDLLTGISREMDKQLWFLEAHLQSDA